MAAGRIVAQGPPPELVLRHAGREVLEVYGPPERLRELERDASHAGLPTRRTGTALAYMRAEELDGRAPAEGQRRPSTLEDAFVALTGQEID
jgi:lipooligosaccharide transport system ATP-binding protein